MKKILITIGVLIVILFIAGVSFFSILKREVGPIACTQEALMCPDGSYVGRTGPKCEFVCPDSQVAVYKDLIQVETPLPESEVSSPLVIKGKARGNWFFEASFPVILTNWDGLIIAEGVAQAEGEWMTTDYVPFTTTLTFTVDTRVSNRGSLILKKDNPSGLPEHDDAFEYTVYFK